METKTRMGAQALVVWVLSSIAGIAGADEGQCRGNFRQEGSFFTGRTFSSWYVLPSESPQVAYKRLYAGIAKSGLKIVNADREMGIISSEQATVGGDGSAATLDYSTVIEAEGKGSKVTITLKSPPTKAMGQASVIDAICKGT